MLTVSLNDDDKLPRSLLEKLFTDALSHIKDRCQEYLGNGSIVCVRGVPYAGTSRIVSGGDKTERLILIIKPGLWRGELPQWNIHCEVFEKDLIKIVDEEIKKRVISQLAVHIGLIIKS